MWRVLLLLLLATPLWAQSLAFHETDHFAPLPPPGEGDWLDTHHEPGQSFAQFRDENNPAPDAQRDAIYLQPVGAPTADLAAVAEFLEAFYRLKVKTAGPAAPPPADLRGNALSSRDLREALEIPDDAFAVLGVTDRPIFAEEVACCHVLFGEADYGGRVAVVSTAPYRNTRLVERLARVSGHEVGHLFGLRHCIEYRCLMNGSSNLEESDARPLHLCPADLRKLHHAHPFEPIQRYLDLRDWAEGVHLSNQAEWFGRRVQFLMGR